MPEERPLRSPETERPLILRIATQFSTLAAALTAAASVIVTALDHHDSSAFRWTAVGMTVVATIAATQSVIAARTQPRLRTIGLLGFPGSGKTVYVSMLFREMMRGAASTIRFVPYGTETIERVNEAIRRLEQRQWLPRTEVNEVFFHRARASMGSGLFDKKYKLEVADFAGERIGEFDSASPMWLHKSEYFKYVLDSDILFLCVDCAAITAEKGTSGLQQQQSALLAAMQIFMGARHVEPPRRLNAPVALLFLKADLLPPHLHKFHLEEGVGSLVSFLNTNCAHWNSFIISSVGGTDDGLPRTDLQPTNVVEPLVWALRFD
jgi:hypothetical protein